MRIAIAISVIISVAVTPLATAWSASAVWEMTMSAAFGHVSTINMIGVVFVAALVKSVVTPSTGSDLDGAGGRRGALPRRLGARAG